MVYVFVCVCLPALVIAERQWESPYLAFANGMGMGLCFFPWCLVGIEQLIVQVFCLARLPHPSLLSIESRLFLGHFCVLLLMFPGCWLLSSTQSGLYDAKRKRREFTVVLLLGS